jgi:putative toxin-antitoxin system antitoxin component (TIGR02293 family)
MANDQETVERSWIDSVIEHAVKVFGDRDEALRWLGTPVRALNYATPISRLSSPDGHIEVMDLLGRLEHGVL